MGKNIVDLNDKCEWKLHDVIVVVAEHEFFSNVETTIGAGLQTEGQRTMK